MLGKSNVVSVSILYRFQGSRPEQACNLTTAYEYDEIKKISHFCSADSESCWEEKMVLEGSTKKSSLQEHRVDALAPYADEGRGKLRKATGSCKQALIRGYPNGGTRRE